jgi:hypothetical protein
MHGVHATYVKHIGLVFNRGHGKIIRLANGHTFLKDQGVSTFMQQIRLLQQCMSQVLRSMDTIHTMLFFCDSSIPQKRSHSMYIRFTKYGNCRILFCAND